ncbi:MAG TPA: hypothetical protein VGL93_14195 [Streptosporangiaceae bacterium]
MHRWKIIAAGTGAGVLLLGGGVAYASTAGPGTAANAAVPAAAQSAKPGAKQPGARRARPLIRRAVHGTFTVRTKKGFRTVEVQRGSVTAVSGGTVTVTSRDKQAHRYTVNGDTRVRLDKKKSDRSHIAKGLRVYVITSPQRGTSVARVIVLRHPK